MIVIIVKHATHMPLKKKKHGFGQRLKASISHVAAEAARGPHESTQGASEC
jgi:hypothetical protein